MTNKVTTAPAKKFNQMNFFQPLFALSQFSSVIFRNGKTITRYGIAATAASEAGYPALRIKMLAKR